MRKIVVFLISIFTAVGLFVGCGLTPPSANSSTSEQTSSSQASVSVSPVFWMPTVFGPDTNCTKKTRHSEVKSNVSKNNLPATRNS